MVTDYGYLNPSESDRRGGDNQSITMLVMHDMLPSAAGCCGAGSALAEGKDEFSTRVGIDLFTILDIIVVCSSRMARTPC